MSEYTAVPETAPVSRPAGSLADLRRALRLVYVEPGRLARAVLAGVGTMGSALALAALSAWLIVRAWEMPPVLDLTVAVVAVRALGISRGLFRYLERLASHDTALRAATTARARIYRALARGDAAQVVTLRRGDLAARTGADVDTVSDVVVRSFVPIAVAGVVSVLAVVILAFTLPAAAPILAVGLLVAGVVAPWLTARATHRAEVEGAHARGEFTEHAVTVIDHAAELRVAGVDGAVLDDARHADLEAVRAADRAAGPAAVAQAATPLAIGVSVLASILIGVVAYGSGATAATSFGIAVLLPLSAFEATSVLPAAAVALTRARAAAGRIVHLVGGCPVPDDDDVVDPRDPGSTGPGGAVVGDAVVGDTVVGGVGASTRRPTLVVDDVCAAWPGGAATGAASVTLRPGDRLAVVGPSGAGKSATLATWAGLVPPVAGTVGLAGDGAPATPLSDLDPATVRATVTYFAEDAHVFVTTVLENLRVANGAVTEDEAVAALRAVGSGEWVEHLDAGVHTMLDAGADSLSGGQRRRLLLARAILSPAPILLLDEPTEHLDAVEGEGLLRALLDREHGLVDADRTVVVVTHQLPRGGLPDGLDVLTVGAVAA